MSIIKFKMKDVLKLAVELEQTHAYSPTQDDLWNAELYPNKTIVDVHGNTENSPEFVWPDHSKIDKSKIEPQLTIVKDQGIYLITNADLEGAASSRGTVAYASGCNPNTDEMFYENSRTLFGGDDGSVSIPLNWLIIAKEQNKRLFQIKVTSTQVSLVQ